MGIIYYCSMNDQMLQWNPKKQSQKHTGPTGFYIPSKGLNLSYVLRTLKKNHTQKVKITINCIITNCFTAHSKWKCQISTQIYSDVQAVLLRLCVQGCTLASDISQGLTACLKCLNPYCRRWRNS